MPSKVNRAILLNFVRRRRLKAPRRSAQVNQSGIKELLTRWTSRTIQLKKIGVPIVSMIVDWGASCYVVDRQLWESLKSGVEAESFQPWCSWFLSFLPQWFIIPSRIQIYDSRRLLITYWLNDFLRDNLVSLVFKLLLHSDLVSSFVLSWYGVFL